MGFEWLHTSWGRFSSDIHRIFNFNFAIGRNLDDKCRQRRPG
jgi:hypothetical protein